MKIHLIAIGGSVMHNLAMALHAAGHEVTGSDDEIYDPSKSRLASCDLLPERMGWDENRIHNGLDAIILGMHAKEDNPELQKARSLELPLFSFPSFVYQHAKHKKRVVVAGSHGKTTTTSIIMHILKENQVDFDYLVGAKLEGFERMVQLSDAPLIILEGDEYLSSPIDSRPKMLHYHADLAVITGIAWDHMNVFPTFEEYVQAFHDFLASANQNAMVFYDEEDQDLYRVIKNKERMDLECVGYNAFEEVANGVLFNGRSYPFQLIGKHNRKNAKAAFHICKQLGLSETDILSAMSSFKGADRRLQEQENSSNTRLFIDFAHAPSKVKATVEAVREKFPDQSILCVLELHTYSSLNPSFIPQYKNSLSAADEAVVFLHQKTLEIKGRPMLEESLIQDSFQHPSLSMLSKGNELDQKIEAAMGKYEIILLMSSGHLGGLDIKKWCK